MIDYSLEFKYMCILAEIQPARRSDIKKRLIKQFNISDGDEFNDNFDDIHKRLCKNQTIIQVTKGVYTLKYNDRLYLGTKGLRDQLNNARMFHLKNKLKNK